ncbi:hypothetical protein D9757_008341 [Collybiopsis confluens]|uniref:RRM domain-containing protein n=1 Tax=Collybiopsis confluens TaxID=2823264 RepID=A0A8H5M5U7_9AGAR|nr:hypothetical protein D9757_008341 [Collybiopsis confluens]
MTVSEDIFLLTDPEGGEGTVTGLTAAPDRDFPRQNGAPNGTITDVKVAFKSDGTSRRFGFVGYKTESEAVKAKEWFDKTFLGSTRISVGVVEGVKNAPKPRPNKRQRVEEEDSSEQVSTKKTKPEPTSTKKDNRMEEFLDVMQTKKGPSWANESQPKASTSAVKLDDTDFMQVEEPVNEEGLSDMEWMRRRMTDKADAEEKVYFQSDDEEDTQKPAEKPSLKKPEEAKDPTKETILQTSRLFLRNLAFSCTDSDLSTLCSRFGELSQVIIFAMVDVG